MRPRVDNMATSTTTTRTVMLYVLAVLVLAILHDATATDDMSPLPMPMPFLLNVRYGRSPPSPADPPRPRRHLEPRTDRFFMGSRYGKRSPWPQLEEPPGPVEPRGLVCEYTGVMTFYHCYTTPTTQHTSYRRREEDPSSMREER